MRLKAKVYSSISVLVIILTIIISTSCQTGTPTVTTTPTPTTTTPATTKTTPPQTSSGLPLVVFQSDDFSGSGNCAICHTNLTDSAGNDVSIDSHWRSTMMANAARDPLWQAKVASEVARNPALKEVIEDKCASCHMPMAYTQAEEDGLSTLMFDDGFLNQDNILYKVAMDGNSCTLCHQIVDPVLGEYHIDTSTDIPDRLIYGPYEDPEQIVMASMSRFKPVYGEQTTQSVLCGTCH
ncbi:MAG: hypothetical protein ABH934_02645 [Chloroflexota bacterium]